MELFKIQLIKYGSNFLQSNQFDASAIDLHYVIYTISIDYPYSNTYFPKGYRVMEDNNEKLLVAHLSSDKIVAGKYLLLLTEGKRDRINANYVHIEM